MRTRKQPIMDFLTGKQNEISQLTREAGDAVDLVTRTMNGLDLINQQINCAIAEIDDYRDKLFEIRAEMARNYDHNAAIISNFSKLLDVDAAEPAGQ